MNSQFFLLIPQGNSVFGIVFFITLLALGIDSCFALQEAFTTGIQDKWKVSTDKLALGFVLVAFVISLIFTTKDGFYWFDIWDKWICDFGLVTVGLAQCIIIGYLYNIQEFRRYLNGVSEIGLGNWWVIALRYVTPVVLVVILITNLRSEIWKPMRAILDGRRTSPGGVFSWRSPSSDASYGASGAHEVRRGRLVGRSSRSLTCP